MRAGNKTTSFATRQMECRREQCGFTLLELMIVLIVMTVVLAVAWPSLCRPFNRAGTLEAARQLAADVAQTRRMAITRGETLALRFSPDGSRYRIEPAEPTTCESDASGDSLDDMLLTEDEPTAAVDESADNEFATSSAVNTGMPGETAADQPLPPMEPLEQELPNNVVFADPDTPIEDDSLVATDSPPVEEPGVDPEDTSAEPGASKLTTLEKLAMADQKSDGENWSTAVLFFPTGRTESVKWRLHGSDDYWVTVTLRGMTGAVQIGHLEHSVRTTSEGADSGLGTADSSTPVQWTDKPTNAAPIEPTGQRP